MKNLNTSIGKLRLTHPIGLAAGFDKDFADAPCAYYKEGFSWVEYGSVTLNPREANPEPNFFPSEFKPVIINNCGMGNPGIEFVSRLRGYFAHGGATVGASIGLIGDGYNFASDIITCINKTHSIFGFYTINLSCPNVGSFVDIHTNFLLTDILREVRKNKLKNNHDYHIFIKISPDIGIQEIENIAEQCLELPIVDGIIATNTTKNHKHGQGGLSGKPLFDKSTRVLASLYKHTQGKVPLVGVGGVIDADSAMRKIQAGASALQVYTGYYYGGSEFIKKLNCDLLRLLNESKFDSILEAVGTDHEAYL